MTDATFKALTDVYGILLKAGWSKPMGRIDGDTAEVLLDGSMSWEAVDGECPKCHAKTRYYRPAVGNAANEAGAIEEWRRYCEVLRGRVTQLEAQLKAGRIDGDVAFNGVDEVGTIDGWRRECERLRQANQRLEAERAKLISEYNDRVLERDTFRDECESLNADQSGDTTAGENEALRIIIRHLAKLL